MRRANAQVGRTARKDLNADQVHLVLEQAALRRRAGEKFTLAAQMFFTPKGLEQSTDEWVAAYKAERFASAARPARSASEGRRLADLCCGIGGDLLAIGCRGTAIGVERNPLAAMFAEANVAAWRAAGRSVNQVEMKSGDVAEIDARQFSAWHLDPDRRPAGSARPKSSLMSQAPRSSNGCLPSLQTVRSSLRRPRCFPTTGRAVPSWNGSAAAANAGSLWRGSAISPRNRGNVLLLSSQAVLWRGLPTLPFRRPQVSRKRRAGDLRSRQCHGQETVT